MVTKAVHGQRAREKVCLGSSPGTRLIAALPANGGRASDAVCVV